MNIARRASELLSGDRGSPRREATLAWWRDIAPNFLSSTRRRRLEDEIQRGAEKPVSRPSSVKKCATTLQPLTSSHICIILIQFYLLYYISNTDFNRLEIKYCYFKSLFFKGRQNSAIIVVVKTSVGLLVASPLIIL